MWRVDKRGNRGAYYISKAGDVWSVLVDSEPGGLWRVIKCFNDLPQAYELATGYAAPSSLRDVESARQ